MKSLLLATSLMAASVGANANWMLDNQHSQLNFITTKNAQVSELHHFTQLSGKLSDTGKLQVEVAVASVETAIPIRNQRMQKFLFTTPSANLSATLSEDVLSLAKGQSMVTEIMATITINDHSQQQALRVAISKDTQGNYVATTAEPFFIKAADYQLTGGIEKLQEVAGLKSITLTVPVSFKVMFSKQ